MSVNIEEILLAKAMQDRQEKVDPAVAMGVGGAAGALAGVGLGSGVRALNQLPGRAIDSLAARRGLSPVPKSFGQTLRPGARMAGGLVGAILGGALGEGMRQSMVSSSPAGAMLAKLQASGGQLSEADQLQLQRVLADSYGGR